MTPNPDNSIIVVDSMLCWSVLFKFDDRTDHQNLL